MHMDANYVTYVCKCVCVCLTLPYTWHDMIYDMFVDFRLLYFCAMLCRAMLPDGVTYHIT